MKTELQIVEWAARFDAMKPESQEKILKIFQILEAGEAATTRTTNGTNGHQDTCSASVDNSHGQAPKPEKMYVELPELDGTEPTLTELGLTLRDEAREMIDTLFNRLTESERLIPEKWVFYRMWNDMPEEYKLELENATSGWAYALLQIGAALAFRISSDPALMLLSTTGGRREGRSYRGWWEG